MNDSAALGRLLGDDARLRILRLLGRERLNVTELTSILGLAQSGVSRHLGLLRDAGLVDERRDAGFAYYQAVRDGANAYVWPWLDARLVAHADGTTRADDARLLEVLRVRKEQFTHPCVEYRELMPGRSWAAWSRALGHLLPRLRVGDFACGEGYLTVEAARWARQVVAVDASHACASSATSMLASASGSASRTPRLNTTLCTPCFRASCRAAFSAACDASTATTCRAQRAASTVRYPSPHAKSPTRNLGSRCPSARDHAAQLRPGISSRFSTHGCVNCSLRTRSTSSNRASSARVAPSACATRRASSHGQMSAFSPSRTAW